MSLPGVIVSAGILGLVAYALVQTLDLNLKATKNVEERFELESIERALIANVSCEETFVAAGLGSIPVASDCNSTATNQVPPFFNLVRETPFGPRNLFGRSWSCRW
ncbi:MAG: hypothetical protein HRU19_15875 [Pseudobacteriovorax sp.]|nr:hypothetical protein [Pseudobacteriovorax sp.]